MNHPPLPPKKNKQTNKPYTHIYACKMKTIYYVKQREEDETHTKHIRDVNNGLVQWNAMSLTGYICVFKFNMPEQQYGLDGAHFFFNRGNYRKWKWLLLLPPSSSSLLKRKPMDQLSTKKKKKKQPENRIEIQYLDTVTRWNFQSGKANHAKYKTHATE